jgi:lysophospholipase L1-like esterase
VKRFLLKLAFSISLTVIGLEAALWLFHPLPVFPQEWRGEYGQNLPGLKPKVVYERNRCGFRFLSAPRAMTRVKPPGTIRVFCLGASTTDQPTQNAEDTWWGGLDARLNQEAAPRGLKVEVYSRGRGGETASDTLRWARLALRPYEPDAVVILQGINDLCWNGGPRYRYPRPEPKSELTERDWGSYPRWKRALRLVSQTYRHISELRNRLRIDRAIHTGAALEWHSSALPELRKLYQSRPLQPALLRDPDPVVEFGDSMNALVKFLRDNQIPTVVCAQPVLWKADMTDREQALLWMSVATPSGFVRPAPAWLQAEMARYNVVQRKVAAEHGALFVDLPRGLESTTNDFFDDCHFTDEGNRRVADVILPALKETLKTQLHSGT